ncbi:MAG TPA: hypothetical protein VMW42_03970 [Desulfatiglandales bacterium]|nr:hypothetical protein [Desulfatiglandales bacterium]
MKYHVYFDAYGHAKRVISEKELVEEYNGDPDIFLQAMAGTGTGDKGTCTSGHVSTLRFESKKELNDFLASLGDEIEGFYMCRSDSRPCNF